MYHKIKHSRRMKKIFTRNNLIMMSLCVVSSFLVVLVLNGVFSLRLQQTESQNSWKQIKDEKNEDIKKYLNSNQLK